MADAKRKLATIVSLDVAGYSARTEADEAKTTAEVAALRQTVEAIAAQHGGRVFNTAGDGFMLEFGSSLAAVEAAITLADGCEPKVRVGVHLGDVVVQPNGDLLGHGVNVAARLMAQSAPGAALVSGAVRSSIRGPIAERLQSRGHLKLDKMAETIEAFAMGGIGETPITVPSTKPDFASIAVLPFADMSADRDQTYLGDGVAEEILNGLAKVKALKVSGRTSSFSFRDGHATVQEIGAALHVSHVLEGSVRKQGNKVRITAQLIQTSDGYHVSSETYDSDLTDIFELQDRVARSVVEKLKMVLEVDDGRIIANMTSSPEAYDAFLKGRDLTQRRKLASGQDIEGELARAITYLEEAIRIDPQFAQAWAWLANAHFYLPEHNNTPDWQIHFDAGRKAAAQAIRLAPELSDANLAMSYGRLLELDLLGSWEARKKAYERDPSSVVAAHEFGVVCGMMGLHNEALSCADKAVAGDPFSANFSGSRGLYQWALGDTKAASASFKRSVELGSPLAAVLRAIIMWSSGDRAAIPYFSATMRANRDRLPPNFQSGPARWLFSLAVIQNVNWAKQIAWLFVKRAMRNSTTPPTAAIKGSLLLLGKAEAYFDEVRYRPNAHLPGALTQLWLPLASARAIRMHPGFPQFVDDIGLVRCWQKLGWPEQVRPLRGTDGSNLQFTCN